MRRQHFSLSRREWYPFAAAVLLLAFFFGIACGLTLAHISEKIL